MAAVAYRAGERIHDQRQDMIHDYSRRGDVEFKELMFPTDAPAWVQGISREDFWNKADAAERRKDSQVAREIRLMIPRELPPEERVRLVRSYVIHCFINRGMVGDVAFHNKPASDGLPQPHAHVMLTMRPLTADGFGQKSRHDWVKSPDGRLHPDGRPVMIESNAESWNSSAYYERCREDWENLANDALARIGSAERIDRRTLLERGLARLPEPALRLAFHLKELHGVMRERFGQFQVAKHYQAVEKRAKAAFQTVEAPPVAALQARAESRAEAPRQEPTPARIWRRFHDWIDRQLERLVPAGPELQPGHAHSRAVPDRTSPPSPDLER